MEQLTTDVCVVGADAAGLAVAASAALMGVAVVLIETGATGKRALHSGATLSGALIASARVAETVRQAQTMGLAPMHPIIDGERVQKHVQAVAAKMAAADSPERYGALGVRVIKGQACFTSDRSLDVGDIHVSARRFVIATGTEPVVPDIPGLAEATYQTGNTIFSGPDLPHRLVILGAGTMGTELAQAYRSLGRDVTLIDHAAMLSDHDGEAVALVRERMRRSGVTLLEHTRVLRVQGLTSGVMMDVDGPHGPAMLNHGDLIIATGRKPCLGGLGLDVAGVAMTDQGIMVDARMRSSNKRIFAVGDCAAGEYAPHAASHEAGVVLRNILFGLRANARPGCAPRIVYSDPEIASIGLSERAALASPGGARIVRSPLSENHRARLEQRTAGFIKVMMGPKGRILGVVIAGTHAAELLAPWGLAMQNGLKISAMAELIPSYPTYGEISPSVATQALAAQMRKPWVQRLIRIVRALG